jgi:hypothetical protein
MRWPTIRLDCAAALRHVFSSPAALLKNRATKNPSSGEFVGESTAFDELAR